MAFDGFRFKKWFHNDIKIWENLEMIVRKVTSSNMGILLGMPANHGEKNLEFLLDPEQTGSVHPGMVSHQSGCGDRTRGYIYNYNYNYVCVCILLYIYIFIIIIILLLLLYISIHMCVYIVIYMYYIHNCKYIYMYIVIYICMYSLVPASGTADHLN